MKEAYTKEGEPVFTTDYRETNPKLHTLYVGYATETLSMVDKCIRDLHSLSKTSVSPMLCALYEERQKLVTEDAAFAEADALLQKVYANVAPDFAKQD